MHNELKAHHKDDGDLQNPHLLSPAAADFISVVQTILITDFGYIPAIKSFIIKTCMFA